MKRCTACAVRADQVGGWEKRYVPFDTTSVRVDGASLPPQAQPGQQEQAGPLTIPHGSSKATRPELQQCVCSTLGVDHAIPLWGTPHEGHASETTVNHPLLAEIATCLAKHGVAPGADIDGAAAARVTPDHRAARGATLCISRFPATSNAGGRLLAEAVAHNTGAAGGVLAHTKPTTHRPRPSSKAYAGEVTLSGTSSRAVVLHSSAQDQRRQQRLARALQASSRLVPTATRLAEPQEDCCRAEADAAAAQLRAVHAASHRVDVTGEERPLDGRGRPSPHQPRPVKAIRSQLTTTISPQPERLVRMEAEAGCFVLRTQVPTAGELTPSAREVLAVDKEQQGTEQHDGLLKAPVLVHSLCLQKPERLEAFGLV